MTIGMNEMGPLTVIKMERRKLWHRIDSIEQSGEQ